MKALSALLLICCISVFQVANAQSSSKDRVAFFNDTSVLNVDIITNTGRFFTSNTKGYKMPGIIVANPTGETPTQERVQLQVRGKSRRELCHLLPLKLIFKDSTAHTKFPFKSVKLVNQCYASKDGKRYLLKEFLVYKLYNLITEQSFRVRLLTVNYKDSSGRKNTITAHGFLLEDVKDLAKRNNCKEWTKSKLRPESTHRRQMTMVALFQYMIGNTDWGVSENHNTNLIQYKDDSMSRPMVVPYDFDNAGIVNTSYAVPDERLGIKNVTERVYRGFPRTMEELSEVLNIFQQQKEKIYAAVNGFNLLDSRSRHDMIKYLDEFYYTIDRPKLVEFEFITHAREN
ncbi:MAG: hypothetical protein ABIN67_08485 [Ferruginibacter sp.]